MCTSSVAVTTTINTINIHFLFKLYSVFLSALFKGELSYMISPPVTVETESCLTFYQAAGYSTSRGRVATIENNQYNIVYNYTMQGNYYYIHNLIKRVINIPAASYDGIVFENQAMDFNSNVYSAIFNVTLYPVPCSG